MSIPSIVPDWFFGFDLTFQMIFFVITLLVAIYAFRIYKLSEQRSIKLFGIGFLLISVSYIFQALVNFTVLERIEENNGGVANVLHILTLHNTGMYIHTLFFMIGLITIAYMTLKVKTPALYWLLVFIVAVSLTFSANYLTVFYVLSIIILLFIILQYLLHYLETNENSTLLVMGAFAFLLISSIHFVVSMNHSFFYIFARFLELLAYALILINLLRITHCTATKKSVGIIAVKKPIKRQKKK